jgi:hypothetical protein
MARTASALVDSRLVNTQRGKDALYPKEEGVISAIQ